MTAQLSLLDLSSNQPATPEPVALEPDAAVYRYRVIHSGCSSSVFGKCDVCDTHASEVVHQIEERLFTVDGRQGWTQAGCSDVFGHEACLIGRRRTTDQGLIRAFLDAAREAGALESQASPENFWWDGERPNSADARAEFGRLQRSYKDAEGTALQLLNAILVDQRRAAIRLASATFDIWGLLTDEQKAAIEASNRPEVDPT